MSKPFRFKQFSLQQQRSAMKVGTDGVLLGAWTSVDHDPQSILDIGAGTGLVALMLAQRCGAELIDAIELDEEAYEECVENFENSPWGDRLFCYHAGLDEFVDEMDETYDLISCNPPYFEPHSGKGNGDQTKDEARMKARQFNSLPFSELLASCARLLSEKGQCSFVIPYLAEEEFLSLAAENKLWPLRICRVRGRADTALVRSLLTLTFQKEDLMVEELVIEKERHIYTEEYRRLTGDFYLNM
ncbi:tRNA1(Val) (adenine(37)-N6)-methyltransferase [Zeaxanthinibacter enoshimensis]|uniref:tRNA1(Val) (adenine(37)-N6)-methyltransferase n=1 Tax=Zeaxanthinibacter enoshimensis TaxID=392009 RepID=A0A4V6PWC0_9FLAO|nr:methyltransferase [Zeaxanthinibacter enoshimensis]TDQ32401.1 tRNA1Val (adenine37-N6)-methyltransferase [Zeaxanthinibacter enoshimensis]